MPINLLCEWSKLRQICLKVIFKILQIGFDAEKNYNFNSGYFKDMCDSAMGRLLIVDFGDIFLNKTGPVISLQLASKTNSWRVNGD